MVRCDLFEQCTFIDEHLANMPVTAAVQKVKYCEMNYEYCARFIAARLLGQDKIPDDLFPYDINRIYEMNADGTNAKPVTRKHFFVQSPDWAAR